MHGKGVLIFTTGIKIEGTFREGGMLGKLKIIFSKDEYYFGYVK